MPWWWTLTAGIAHKSLDKLKKTFFLATFRRFGKSHKCPMQQHYKPQTLWACPTNLSPWLGGLQLRDIRGEHCASAGCCAHAVMMASTNVALHVSKLTKKTGRTNANNRSAIAWSYSIKRAAGLRLCWSNVVWSCCQQLSNELSNYPKQVYDLNC
jgi:hypothetical protein